MRWRTIDDGEPALFGVDELTEPVRGTGRLSGLEFLHVAARRILNRVPDHSRAPANWTINVYRGCSHACVYCLAGDTPIFMADRGTKPIAEIRPGDVVYGTELRGTRRRHTSTEVIDHWRTLRPAHRIELRDGTSVVASGDHRFLTTRGWTFVAPTHVPSLRASDELVRVDQANVGVSSVASLGVELPMYDMTTGTGDFIAAGVISHNCFARPTHDYLGLNIGEDFDRRIVVKVNAVDRLRAELAEPRWAGEAVAMGTNTDPYQRAEGKYRLTRGVVEVLGEHANPFSILTKSPMVTRDLDLLQRAASRADVSVNFSIGTLDERVWRASEPGTPHPRRRLAAMAELANAGIRTGALVAPILPDISDRPEQLREVVDAVADAGGELLGIGALHLRGPLRDHFLDWLRGARPELIDDYERRYAHDRYAPSHYVRDLRRRAGLPVVGDSRRRESPTS